MQYTALHMARADPIKRPCQIRPRARRFRNPTHIPKRQILEKAIEMGTVIEIVMEAETERDIDVDTDHYIAVANVAAAQLRSSTAVEQ